MKNLIIFCDGGLGNRLGALIGGVLTAKQLNREPIICWPENTWCGCSFDDLFESVANVIQLDINTLFNKHKTSPFLIHENQTKLDINQLYPNKANIDTLIESEEDIIIYYHNSIPEHYSETSVLEVLSQLQIKNTIKKAVSEYCIERNINETLFGIHFRKTDFQFFLNEDDVYNHIKSKPDDRFFICSDSLETEEKFSILDNVSSYPKNNYVKKLAEGSWNNLTTDNEGRSMTFNVNRSKESVIEGFIDMLILSKTNIIVDSHSSFLKFAKLYNKLKI